MALGATGFAFATARSIGHGSVIRDFKHLAISAGFTIEVNYGLTARKCIVKDYSI